MSSIPPEHEPRIHRIRPGVARYASTAARIRIVCRTAETGWPPYADLAMTRTWDTTTGVLHLPSGRDVRGRGLRRAMPDGALPEFGLYLLGKPPARLPWDTRWVRWPEFRLPADPHDGQRPRLSRRAGRRTRRCCGRLRPRALRRAGGRDALAAPLRRAIQHRMTPSRIAIPEWAGAASVRACAFH